MNPLVSIIIPVFNVETYLRSCLCSVVNQTYRNIEIIAIDDGSTDNSLKILKELEREIAFLRIISIPHSGINQARKIGVENAIGEWIVFVDADDLLAKDAVKLLIESSVGYDVVSGEYKFIDEGGKVLDKSAPINECIEGDRNRLITDLLIDTRHKALWRQLIRKQIISPEFFNTDKDLVIGEDYITMLQIALNAKKFKGIDKVIYFYRWHQNSTVHKKYDKEEQAERIASSIFELFKDNFLDSYFREPLNKRLIRYYIECHNKNKINKNPFARYLRKQIRYMKFFSLKERAYSIMLFLPSSKLRHLVYRLVFNL